MNYVVLQSTVLQEVVDQCNEHMTRGYLPSGGIVVVLWHGSYFFAQTMFKHDHTWYGKETT